jgi:hypothetical protein
MMNLRNVNTAKKTDNKWQNENYADQSKTESTGMHLEAIHWRFSMNLPRRYMTHKLPLKTETLVVPQDEFVYTG